jgi:hypothetical protein
VSLLLFRATKGRSTHGSQGGGKKPGKDKGPGVKPGKDHPGGKGGKPGHQPGGAKPGKAEPKKAAGGGKSGKGEPEPQGISNMQLAQAIPILKTTVKVLNKANHDYGGHRAGAVNDLNQAIEQLQLAMKYEKNHKPGK